MKKIGIYFVVAAFLFALAACSGENNASQSTSEGSGADSGGMIADDSGTRENTKTEQVQYDSGSKEKNDDLTKVQGDRMVIYHANMAITVTEFEKTQDEILDLINTSGGYVVESSTAQSEKHQQHGSITARIPQPKFRSFLNQVEDLAKEVEHRSVNGQDVTEEYVDLESRLKAKQAVRDRLKTFLENAKNTEDLLDISENLSQVQEEIEQIKGRMQYLENQSALSTVTIRISEQNIALKQSEDLNTWERTKQAFINSVNGLLSFFSFVVVFIVGYSPVLILLAVIGWIAYFQYHRRKNRT